MVNDHLSDFVTRIRNGYMAGLSELAVPQTRAVFEVARVLQESGYIEKAEKISGTRQLLVRLKYKGKKPALTGIKRVSKPGARIYTGSQKIPRIFGGLGINILSTPSGIMADKQAKKLNTGGEIIASVW